MWQVMAAGSPEQGGGQRAIIERAELFGILAEGSANEPVPTGTGDEQGLAVGLAAGWQFGQQPGQQGRSAPAAAAGRGQAPRPAEVAPATPATPIRIGDAERDNAVSDWVTTSRPAG